MALQVRMATAGDVAAIVENNCRLALETEQVHLDADVVRSGVERGLALAPEVLYFVADLEGVTIGQVMFTREWSDWRNGWMAWLQSVYVVEACRGQGVFRQLLESAVEKLIEDCNPVCLRLYVEQANETAIRCYRRLGFAAGHYNVMERPLATRCRFSVAEAPGNRLA